ncbi:MAG: hypothetical protein J2O46_08800, partial [Nocardioides sp.]|nr:hypothetical protein [Nocardioides sp.]
MPPPGTGHEETSIGVDTPVEAYLYDEPATVRTGKQAPVPAAPEPESQPEIPGTSAPAAAETVEEQPRPKPRTSTRRKRASVPSWDEIMFGGGKQE